MGAPLLARDLRSSFLREQVASNLYETVKEICFTHGVILPNWDELIDKHLYYQKTEKMFDNLKFSLFWQKVDRNGPVIRTELGPCWMWRGRIEKRSKYGKFDVNEVDSYAHRVMWEIVYGPIPKGLFVCHQCDNPPCVRPDHLFLGTPRDNSVDRTNKGRTRGPVGELNGMAKLTEFQVREILVGLTNGRKVTEIAKTYKVGSSAISEIKAGKRWKHVQLQST